MNLLKGQQKEEEINNDPNQRFVSLDEINSVFEELKIDVRETTIIDQEEIVEPSINIELLTGDMQSKYGHILEKAKKESKYDIKLNTKGAYEINQFRELVIYALIE